MIWIADGDENTKFFQNYAKHRKNIKTICETRRKIAQKARSFKETAKEGVGRVQGILQEPPRSDFVDVKYLPGNFQVRL